MHTHDDVFPGCFSAGAVYICTEDSFPIKRLQQLIADQPSLRSDVPPSLISRLQFSDHVYVEHAADLVSDFSSALINFLIIDMLKEVGLFYLQNSLRMCLCRRVPLLLARGMVRLLVVDSVAALFRCEFQAADWLERTKQILSVSSTLHYLSQEFTTPVLCINQVTHTCSVYQSCFQTTNVMISKTQSH